MILISPCCYAASSIFMPIRNEYAALAELGVHVRTILRHALLRGRGFVSKDVFVWSGRRSDLPGRQSGMGVSSHFRNADKSKQNKCLGMMTMFYVWLIMAFG
jgi:hypothetical protein